MIISATYSPEDNKLRLYADARLDDETYQHLKKNKFKWAPVQKLFVSYWTPAREDICLKFVDSIGPEETTLIERAENKAGRLEALASKRLAQSNAFYRAAKKLTARFADGQPILIGHHSQRRAERDRDRAHNNMDNCIKAQNAVEYWNYRATGVEHHANRKSSRRTRFNRIKKLLAQLRVMQRVINEATKNRRVWEKLILESESPDFLKNVTTFSGFYDTSPQLLNSENNQYERMYWLLENGRISAIDACNKSIAFLKKQETGEYRARCISHTLNRLAYETLELGGVARFKEELSAVILQKFLRTHGADTPKCKKSALGWSASSSVDFPLHVADGNNIDLSDEEWRDLMEQSGYEVPDKIIRRQSTKTQAPLINPSDEDAKRLQNIWNEDAAKKKYGSPSELLEMNQKNYSVNSNGDYGRYQSIPLDASGRRIYRGRGGSTVTAVCRVRVGAGSGFYGADRIIVIIDKPQKSVPISWSNLEKVAA